MPFGRLPWAAMTTGRGSVRASPAFSCDLQHLAAIAARRRMLSSRPHMLRVSKTGRTRSSHSSGNEHEDDSHGIRRAHAVAHPWRRADRRRAELADEAGQGDRRLSRPGGSVDQVARILAQQLTMQTGQSFIVDNRGGASGSIGTAALAKADPGRLHDRRRVRHARGEPVADSEPALRHAEGPDAADAGRDRRDGARHERRPAVQVVHGCRGRRQGQAGQRVVRHDRRRQPRPPRRWRNSATSSASSSTTFRIAAAVR